MVTVVEETVSFYCLCPSSLGGNVRFMASEDHKVQTGHTDIRNIDSGFVNVKEVESS